MRRIIILILVLLLAACNLPAELTPTPAPTASPTKTTPVTPLPPVAGQNPSYRVGAFYYPWYGNPANDGKWIHWTDAGYPMDIDSDFYPALGPYSSNDRAVVAQHMVWLRQAGIGVIIVSWWGQGCTEEKPDPLLLEMGRRYGIKIAFHIEPYGGRTTDRLVSDVRYLYRRYGSDPAFFHTTASSRYNPGENLKPMFFVWNIRHPDNNSDAVEAEYWQKAVDAIHAMPGGGLVVADTVEGTWVTGGHFDGLYNYATLHLKQSGGFSWAASLPPDSLYIPSVIPGFSAIKIHYPADSNTPRLDGETYNDQWTSALDTPVEPAMVTVTSFNEWHEGSMIEPPAAGMDNGQGFTYSDFGVVPADGYLTMTREWVDRFLSTTWPEPIRIRIQIASTSDWTTLRIDSGGKWLRPELISTSPGITFAGMESGDAFALIQPIDEANKGNRAEMTWDVQFTSLDPSGNLILDINRGDLGRTEIQIFNYLGNTPVKIKEFGWSGKVGDRNSFHVTIPVSLLVNPIP